MSERVHAAERAVSRAERRKDSASQGVVKTMEARWERQSGKSVKAVRMDGAKELCQGDLGNYLESKGIIIQQSVAYAHQQNRKAECFVRTIEDSS